MSIIISDNFDSYRQRTIFNAGSARTVYFYNNANSPGYKLTKRYSLWGFHPVKVYTGSNGEVFFDYSDLREVAIALEYDKTKELNIAGNSIYRFDGVDQHELNCLVYRFIDSIHKSCKIEKIYSGGQSGADHSGIVAGFALGIPVEANYPKGFKRCFNLIKGVEYFTLSEILKEIKNDVELVKRERDKQI